MTAGDGWPSLARAEITWRRGAARLGCPGTSMTVGAGVQHNDVAEGERYADRRHGRLALVATGSRAGLGVSGNGVLRWPTRDWRVKLTPW